MGEQPRQWTEALGAYRAHDMRDRHDLQSGRGRGTNDGGDGMRAWVRARNTTTADAVPGGDGTMAGGARCACAPPRASCCARSGAGNGVGKSGHAQAGDTALYEATNPAIAHTQARSNNVHSSNDHSSDGSALKCGDSGGNARNRTPEGRGRRTAPWADGRRAGNTCEGT